VFRAYDPEQDKLVAVKLFRFDFPPDRVHRLVAELQTLIDADLTHPAIAAPLAAGITGVSAYLAQDFVVAESVDVLGRTRGPAGAAEAVRVATQVAGALDFAAALNIGHGALHPRDVLVSSDETRLTGLGLTQALERVGAATAVRRPYAAPERAAGAPWDRRADVFSLAAIVYEQLWARRVTALGQQAVAALTEIAGGDLEALRCVFACALAEDPAERFETALEFAAALSEAISVASPQPASLQLISPEGGSPRISAMELDRDEPRLPLDDTTGWAAAGEEGDFDVAQVIAELSLGLGGQPQVDQTASAAAPIAADSRRARSEPAASHNRNRDDAVLEFDRVEPGEQPSAGHASVVPAPASLDMAETALDRSRSSVWPLTLALVLGVAVGFALGYGVASRARQSPSAPAEALASPPASARAATQGGVAETEVRLVPAPGSGSAEPKPAPPPAVRTPPASVERSSPASGRPVQPLPAPAGAGGRLLIRSTPDGAAAFLDGRDIGRTPVTMRDVERGPHSVRVVREGYVVEERRVTITADRPSRSLTFELTRARPAELAPAASAALEREKVPVTVESRPAGASVFVDGTLIGKTPLTLGEVAAGDHAVSLDLDGYRRWSSSVRIVAGERNRITASLEKP
jgi:hypothetical protein